MQKFNFFGSGAGNRKPQGGPRRYHSSDPKKQAQQDELRATAEETIKTLRTILPKLDPKGAAEVEEWTPKANRRNNPAHCPRHPNPAIIKVMNADTLNAALLLLASDPKAARPAVLNFANAQRPGGGWKNGRIAQEEAIFYRSSLSASLDPRLYPLAEDQILYSPSVYVIREDMDSGHALLPGAAGGDPRTLPAVSVLTVAAIDRPETTTFRLADDRKVRDKHVFTHDSQRDATKLKMRMALRCAAFHGHDTLVLGALGCGVFGNPPEDVAHCWLEVLREDEFSGNWWRYVWFAVYEPNRNVGNYELFKRILSGQRV